MTEDVATVAALLAHGTLCVGCIARKTGLREPRVFDLLGNLRQLVGVASTVQRCGICLKQTVVHRLQ